MNGHLFYFRPGEEKRMLARCQFGVNVQGQCGATLTYPIKGYPWRRNIVKSYEFDLSGDEKQRLFSEVQRIRREHPHECLSNEQLWADASEKGNSISRDRGTGTLCYTIGVYRPSGETEEYYAMRENSPALVASFLFKTIVRLLEPYERL